MCGPTAHDVLAVEAWRELASGERRFALEVVRGQRRKANAQHGHAHGRALHLSLVYLTHGCGIITGVKDTFL